MFNLNLDDNNEMYKLILISTFSLFPVYKLFLCFFFIFSYNIYLIFLDTQRE